MAHPTSMTCRTASGRGQCAFLTRRPAVVPPPRQGRPKEEGGEGGKQTSVRHRGWRGFRAALTAPGDPGRKKELWQQQSREPSHERKPLVLRAERKQNKRGDQEPDPKGESAPGSREGAQLPGVSAGGRDTKENPGCWTRRRRLPRSGTVRISSYYRIL
jgi:hypothetical protein